MIASTAPPEVPLRHLVTCLDGRRIPLNSSERAEMPGDFPYWGAGGVLDHVERPLFSETLVLLGEDGAPFFEPGKDVAHLVREPVWVNNHIHVLRPHSSVDAQYLTYSLNAVDYARYISGSTRDKLTQDDMRRISVSLPPLDEQRRIADFLDTETARLDALGSLRERQRRLLADELASLLEAALVRPHEGTRVPLMHLTDPRRPIQYGIVLPGSDWPGGVPIIKGGDIAGRRLTPEDLKRTDPEIERRYVRSRVHDGDYVIAIRGSVGEIALVPASLSGANLTQDSARIAPYDCDAAWLGAVLRTPDLQNQMRQQTTGATIKGINISELRRLRVPTPPLVEQPRLGQRAAEHFRRAHAADEALRASVALLAERRQALITAAVTGQLDVTTARGGHS